MKNLTLPLPIRSFELQGKKIWDFTHPIAMMMALGEVDRAGNLQEDIAAELIERIDPDATPESIAIAKNNLIGFNIDGACRGIAKEDFLLLPAPDSPWEGDNTLFAITSIEYEGDEITFQSVACPVGYLSAEEKKG